MAETMILALDGRYESYSLGKHVQIERVREIARLARKHGFRLSAIC
jgi:predicted amino acid dehydrogenase